MFLIDTVHFADGQLEQWSRVREEIEAMTTGHTKTIGLIWRGDDATTDHQKGWHHTKDTAGNKDMYQSALSVGACQAGLGGITTIRYGKGAMNLPALKGFQRTELWLWISSQSRGGWHLSTPPVIFDPGDGDIENRICLKMLVKEFPEVTEAHAEADQLCFLQFLGMKNDEAEEQAIIHSRIPLI